MTHAHTHTDIIYIIHIIHINKLIYLIYLYCIIIKYGKPYHSDKWVWGTWIPGETPDFPGLQRVCGVDVSFFSDRTYAIATVVILSFPKCLVCSDRSLLTVACTIGRAPNVCKAVQAKLKS